MIDTLAASSAARPAEWRDYVALMKPRVMSLVVFTAFVGLLAAPADVNPILAAAIVLAIALGAGGAGALNMAYDADIDAVMRRTCARPVPAGKVSRAEAMTFGLVMSALAVTLLALAGGPLAAGLLAFTIFFYAVIYTMWLKRSTAQNIVIGGLAGALPPAVAWAGATGSLGLDPALMVAIIFFWTPPHFWALALYKQGDYAKAGVPMLPNVAGAPAARLQILLYALLLAPLGLAPVATGLGGWLYAAVSIGLGAMFVLLAVRVARSRAGEAGTDEADLYEVKMGDRAARDLFAFSILYLFGLFAALLAEHGLGLYAATPFVLGGVAP
jgi:protoheme IX farnesyltransferase